jgi:2-polyprenyl-6-methoxyphenol hydroxylase-like FAD-dependent oxidoreductase
MQQMTQRKALIIGGGIAGPVLGMFLHRLGIPATIYEASSKRWPVYDVPSLPTWHRGPVCLIGDAAHAISPHVGQGASLALEDAIELARCLRDLPDVQSAFAGFERLRRSRVEKMVREARRTGNRKAASNPVTRGIRDLILPFFLKLGVKGIQQVYAHTVEWEKRVA